MKLSQLHKNRSLLHLKRDSPLGRVAVSVNLLLRRSNILGITANQLGHIWRTGGSQVDANRVADAVGNGRRGVDVGETEAVLNINSAPVDGDLERVGSIRSPVCESHILSGSTPGLLGSRGGEGKAGEEGSGGSDELHFEWRMREMGSL